MVHCSAPHDVFVGRPSPWGNPFSHDPKSGASIRVQTRSEAIKRHREWVLSDPELVERIRRELRGRVLSCWCAPRPCHGDTLAEIANSEEEL